jgi:hypothetical protein
MVSLQDAFTSNMGFLLEGILQHSQTPKFAVVDKHVSQDPVPLLGCSSQQDAGGASLY